MERLTFDKDDNRREACPIKFDIDGEDTISKFCENVCDEWEDNCPFMAVGKRLQEYEDTNLTPEQIVEIDRLYREKCEKVAKYQQLEEKGLLLRLPCKVGDIVYFPIYDYHDSAIIETIRIEENGVFFDWVQYEVGVDCTEVWDNGSFADGNIGKTVFLTREEAEQALERMKEVQDVN